MKLTTNFSLKEFIISRFYSKNQQKQVFKDFKKDPELLENAKELAVNLQVLRDYLNTVITINIAYRPKWYELFKKRTGKSQHCYCKAADIKAKGYTPLEVYDAIVYLISIGKMQQGGVGRYNTFTHYDVYYDKINVRRWNFTK